MRFRVRGVSSAIWKKKMCEIWLVSARGRDWVRGVQGGDFLYCVPGDWNWWGVPCRRQGSALFSGACECGNLADPGLRLFSSGSRASLNSGGCIALGSDSGAESRRVPDASPGRWRNWHPTRSPPACPRRANC